MDMGTFPSNMMDGSTHRKKEDINLHRRRPLNQWMHFILDDPKYGTTRKASEALEDAMRCYLEQKTKKKHTIDTQFPEYYAHFNPSKLVTMTLFVTYQHSI